MIGRQAIVVGDDLKPGILQRLDEKAPHIGVVFSQQILDMTTQHPGPAAQATILS